MREPTFEFSLRASCFVLFLSAELKIAAGETAWFSTGDADYEGKLDSASARSFHDLAVSSLRTCGSDPAWTNSGLDGTDYCGSFDSPLFAMPEFRFWSPEPGTPPRRLACAALELLPLNHADGSLEYDLERLREGLGIGVPLRWVSGKAPRLRIVGNLDHLAASQIESLLAQAPSEGDLVIDVRLCDLSSIRGDAGAQVARLARRAPPATWLVSADIQFECARSRSRRAGFSRRRSLDRSLWKNSSKGAEKRV